MKKLFSLLTALLIIAASASMCFAARNDASLPNVYDDAGIFSTSEEQAISDKCDRIIEKYNLDIAVVAFGQKGEYNLQNTADDIYDYNGFGCGEDNSGTLLYICMDPSDRGWHTTTCGKAEKYYTEDNINYIDDNLYPYMVAGRYADGVLCYLDLVDELYANGKFNINQGYTYNPEPYQTPHYEPTLIEKLANAAVPAGVVGLIAGLISLSIAKKSMKSVAKASTAGQYLDRRSIDITIMRDIFLYRSTHRVKIQKQQPSSSHPGGRSSYSGGHTSHSGSHHGGGGRHF